MQLLGLVCGFFLGNLLLGPLGALFGAFLGYQFVLGLNQQPFSQQSSHAAPQFIQTLFSTMGYINKLKGRVTQQDIQIAEQWMQKLRLDKPSCQWARNAFRKGKQPHFLLRQQLRDFHSIAVIRPDWQQLFLQAQLPALIQADLQQPAIQQTLQLFLEELPLSPQQWQQLLSLLNDQTAFEQTQSHYHHWHWQETEQQYFHQERSYQTTPERQGLNLTKACQILGVQSEDEPATIKKAYRKLMLQHHPDKLATKKLSVIEREKAKELAQKIQAAFDFIKRQRNFK